MGKSVDVDSETPYMNLKGDIGWEPADPNLAREIPSFQGLPEGIPYRLAANGSAEDIVQLHTQLRQHVTVTEASDIWTSQPQQRYSWQPCCHLLSGIAATTDSAFIGWMYTWPFLVHLLFLLPLGILNVTLPIDSVIPLLLNRVVNTLGAATVSCLDAITLIIYRWLTSELCILQLSTSGNPCLCTGSGNQQLFCIAWSQADFIH